MSKKKIDVYRTGIYLRLSQGDEDIDGWEKQESNNISNQRLLLEGFIDAHDDLKLVDVFIDDGYTGSNFNRSEFQRMMKSMKAGNLDCIMVKDLSRLGRERIGVDELILRTFKEYGVRFISVSDNYDSLTANSGADGKCNISVLDSTMEEVVLKSLQLFIDMWVDSRKIVDMQREKQAQRLALAEKHLLDMEKSYERINKDLRDAYESYKLAMTDRETYLEQRKSYEQLLVRMQDNIEKQKAAVSKMAQVDLPEVAGFEMLEGQMKLQKLNKEIVDAFVAEIVVYDKERVEIKWKFRDEFRME